MRAFFQVVIVALACLGGLLAAASAWGQQAGCCVGPSECQYPQYVPQGQCGMPACGGGMPCASDICSPCWSVYAEAVVMQRAATRNQTLFEDLYTDDVALNARDINFPVALGYEVGAIRHDVCGCGWDLEIAYFQIDGFDAKAFVPDTTRMLTDRDGRSLVVTDADVRYTSAFYNGELNARKQFTDWLTLLAGFRMGQLNERYTAAGANGLNSLGIDTFNHLYGLQLGAEAEVYNMGGPLVVRATCKAGAYDNVAHQHYLRTEGGVADIDDGARRDQASFLGEAGLVATYALTKHLAFRASAEAMWLTGVALAPEQLRAVDLGRGNMAVNTSGALFYYGGGLGLEYRY